MQQSYSLREPWRKDTRSPETDEQVAQVRKWFAYKRVERDQQQAATTPAAEAEVADQEEAEVSVSTPVPVSVSVSALLGLSKSEAQRLATRVPCVRETVEREVFGGAKSLRALQARLQLTDKELKAAVMRLPQLLLDEYDVDVAPRLEALQKRLELTNDELKALVIKLPQVLGLDHEAEVRPKLDELQRAVGYSDSELKAEVLRKPSSIGVEVRGGAGQATSAPGTLPGLPSEAEATSSVFVPPAVAGEGTSGEEAAGDATGEVEEMFGIYDEAGTEQLEVVSESTPREHPTGGFLRADDASTLGKGRFGQVFKGRCEHTAEHEEVGTLP